MKKIIPVIVILVIAGASIFFYINYRTTQQAQAAVTSIQTAKLETGSLSVTISAIGKVRTNQSANLVWQTSGAVAQVDARVGEPVKAGQILATLEQTSLPQSVILAQGDLASAQLNLDDLYTQADTSRVQSMADIVTYEQAVRDAQYQLDNFTTPSNMSGQDAVAALEAMKVILDEARVKFEPYKYLPSGNATRKDRLETLNLAQADYNTAVKRLQYEYDLSVAQANLDKARREYEKWKTGPQAADMDAAKAKVAAAQATLSQAWIEAPFDGVITAALPKVGDIVSANSKAFQIDDLNSLYVDLAVSEIDINLVEMGQTAVLTFDALRDKQYHGKVVDVGMTGAENSGVVNYTVTVQLGDPDAAVRPGMTSEVELTVDEKIGVLLVPNQAIQAVNGETIVTVSRPGQQPVPVTIRIGIANDTFTEVLEGDLQAGDEVLLADLSEDDAQVGGGFMGPMGGGPPDENANRSVQPGDAQP